MNTGVIPYRNTPGFRALVANSIAIFESQPLEYDDQPAFRAALYALDLRFAVLTFEYNLRACFAYFLGGNVEVKIIHARDPVGLRRPVHRSGLNPTPGRGRRAHCGPCRTTVRARATASASSRSEYQTSTTHSCAQSARTIS
ncbi:MAG: hypothetical protein QOK16_2705 [Solirubrobacteraceae bacterium]|nr:hypothetical protein [Solirubrobacteraceae bacterium]